MAQVEISCHGERAETHSRSARSPRAGLRVVSHFGKIDPLSPFVGAAGFCARVLRAPIGARNARPRSWRAQASARRILAWPDIARIEPAVVNSCRWNR